MGVHYFLFTLFLCILNFPIQGLKKFQVSLFIPFDPAIPLLDICPPVPKDTCTGMLITVLFGLERKITWKQSDDSTRI